MGAPSGPIVIGERAGPGVRFSQLRNYQYGTPVMNDAGQIAFLAKLAGTFTDGTSGIFTAQVPEPAGVGLLALPLVLRRRRSRLVAVRV